MEKETKLIFGAYILALAAVVFSSFQSAYKILAPFLFEGAGHKVGWVLAIQLISLSALVGIVALTRLIVVIKQGGLKKAVPTVALGKFLRYLSLIFLFMAIIYKVTAYSIAIGIPFGWVALIFEHLVPPFALILVLFEASRIYALESAIAPPNQSSKKDAQKSRASS